MDLVSLASVQFSAPLHRLRFHPTLPLLATSDALHQAVHVWTWNEGKMRLLASPGDRTKKLPASFSRGGGVEAAWHPTLPMLAVTGLGGVQLWDCSFDSGVRRVGSVGILPAEERTADRFLYTVSEGGAPFGPVKSQGTITRTPPSYFYAAFSPLGRSLWASPSSDGVEFRSDWFTPEETAGEHFSYWDTEMVAHPEGVLVATFESEQMGTLLRFASVQPGLFGDVLQPLRRALMMDVDGYEGLSFSPRGERFLFRGNAYDNACYLYDFPSLRVRCVLFFEGRKELEKKLPVSWQRRRWSFFESADFAPDGSSVLVGLSSGRLIDFELASQMVRSNVLLLDHPICSLRVRHGDGLLAVSDFTGLLQIHQLGHKPLPPINSRSLSREFLAHTSPASRFATQNELDVRLSWGGGEEEPVIVRILPEGVVAPAKTQPSIPQGGEESDTEPNEDFDGDWPDSEESW
jgi:WD40 repeat protein